MRRILTVGVLLALMPAGEAVAQERFYMGFSADSILGSCTSKTPVNQGFCYGFIYAMAFKLHDEKKSCAIGPANFDVVVRTAVEALSNGQQERNSASTTRSLNRVAGLRLGTTSSAPSRFILVVSADFKQSFQGATVSTSVTLCGTSSRFMANELYGMGAALFDVTGGVARFLRCCFAHENMCAKRRQNAFVGFVDGCLVRGDILRSGILDDDAFEPCLF